MRAGEGHEDHVSEKFELMASLGTHLPDKHRASENSELVVPLGRWEEAQFVWVISTRSGGHAKQDEQYHFTSRWCS